MGTDQVTLLEKISILFLLSIVIILLSVFFSYFDKTINKNEQESVVSKKENTYNGVNKDFINYLMLKDEEREYNY